MLMKNVILLISLFLTLPHLLEAQTKTVRIEPTDDTYIGAKVSFDQMKTAPYPIGGAVSLPNLRDNQQYRETIIREFSSITAINAMKMGRIWMSRGNYNFRDVDYIVDFAQQNNIRVHGHCLIWYKQSETSMPKWIKDLAEDTSLTKEDWKQLMKEYISKVVGRYKGKVTSWDVVNEAIDGDGEERTNDIWRDKIGFPDYIEWAFQCAHEADPNAILFYNDYGYDYSAKKQEKTDEMIKKLLSKNIPIHGYGIQAHINLQNRNEGKFREYLVRAQKLNLYIHISELDIQCNAKEDPNQTYTDLLKKKQAGLFNEITAAVANLPKNQCYGITFWGVADVNSELKDRPDWPFVLGEKYEHKIPAYYYFVKGFDGNPIPWSKINLTPTK